MPLFSDIHNAEKKDIELPNLTCKDEYIDFYHSFFENEKSFYGQAILREHTCPQLTRKGGWKSLDASEREREAYELAQKHNKHFMHEATYNENKIILKNMIDLLIENNIRPIITILPFSKEYLKYIDGRYKEILLQVLDELSGNINLDFIDMNDIDIFTENDILNSDHLNHAGALKATVIMNEMMKNL